MRGFAANKFLLHCIRSQPWCVHKRIIISAINQMVSGFGFDSFFSRNATVFDVSYFSSGAGQCILYAFTISSITVIQFSTSCRRSRCESNHSRNLDAYFVDWIGVSYCTLEKEYTRVSLSRRQLECKFAVLRRKNWAHVRH